MNILFKFFLFVYYSLTNKGRSVAGSEGFCGTKIYQYKAGTWRRVRKRINYNTYIYRKVKCSKQTERGVAKVGYIKLTLYITVI